MRVVVALGGNALLRRGEPLTADAQRANIRAAAPGLRAVSAEHQLVLSHGNGPQVGLLAAQSTAYSESAPYPLDVLGAQTEGMIGYLLEQELRGALPPTVPLATLLTMVEVDPEDPAFADPTKFIGAILGAQEARRLAAQTGWEFRPDGTHWRRVVPSPEPRRIREIRPIRWLLDRDVVVICAGGGGIPTLPGNGTDAAVGVEAVVDKDLTSELLARAVDADLLVMATDVDGVYTDWGTPRQRRLVRVCPADLNGLPVAAGSMGPKVRAAVRFVEHTGNRAVIGALRDVAALVAGDAGTQVVPEKALVREEQR
ncbi:carbamate kinase [Virgisporangium aliadipatigenens]|uniref:Carbamate kinase n=1 Tax=Virgisporangium aliadipatigenens TaxID=741659 RepID=A0A8J4DR96_9ACTN|nr:carbamate kinase [Virgisporangium aliadipatigenens]GIJ47905.1 carbamate kinase [Virgisporangium aliadipatigenens]